MSFADPIEQAAFRQLAEIYATAVDGRRPELFERIMTEDIVIIGPTFRAQGLAEVRAIPQMLEKRFLVTRHAIHNQLVEISGDEASGEVYCTADHIWENADGQAELTSWCLRYEDRFVRQGGVWRFASRHITVDWSEARPLEAVRGHGSPLARLPSRGDAARACKA